MVRLDGTLSLRQAAGRFRWDRAADEAYAKLAPVEALRLFRTAADLATRLTETGGEAREKRRWRALLRTGTLFPRRRWRHVPVVDRFVLTPLHKAQWQRKMSNLCLSIALQVGLLLRQCLYGYASDGRRGRRKSNWKRRTKRCFTPSKALPVSRSRRPKG